MGARLRRSSVTRRADTLAVVLQRRQPIRAGSARARTGTTARFARGIAGGARATAAGKETERADSDALLVVQVGRNCWAREAVGCIAPVAGCAARITSLADAVGVGVVACGA